jgi:uncharacterized protein
MIRAVFWQNPQKHIFKFSVNGHSGLCEAGSDIVCAAASAMALSTVNGLTEIIGIPVDCIIEDGDMLIELPNNISSENKKLTQVLLRTLHLGFKALHDEYPDNIKLKLITLSNSGGEHDAKNEHTTIRT